MAFKWIGVMDIYEIIRRWHDGQAISDIAHSMGYDRKTVRKYIQQLSDHTPSPDKPLPPREQLIEPIQRISSCERKRRPPTAQQILEPFRDEIDHMVNKPKDPLLPKIAFELLCEKYGLDDQVSYSSFKRFVRAHRIVPSRQKITARIEVSPGSEIQLDYGYMGLLYDPVLGRRRKVYAFIATLSYSRHLFVQYVYKQTKESFVASHVDMFAYFGGVSTRALLDNLKSGVIKPDLYDPKFNPLYRELAEHYGIFLDPCRRADAQAKGKVERQVPVARQQFRKAVHKNPGLQIDQANREILLWCEGKRGHRDHGTTGWKPYPHFLEHEKPLLNRLPETPFEIAAWKECTVHADHFIQFKKKTYSMPTVYIGKTFWVRGTDKLIQVFDSDYQIIKQHVITPHYRHTDWSDFPENIQAALDQDLPDYLQKTAAEVGPRFRQLIRKTLEPHAFMNLRKAQGLVRLMEKYKYPLLETAAARTLDDQLSHVPKNFVRLLETLTEQQQEQNIPVSLFTQEFIRPMDYFEHKP
ncbi:hypothetical protein BVY01_02645 [bacterium I07]|nr:hypothetical protein BVY01_02645 [bacterium I07]